MDKEQLLYHYFSNALTPEQEKRFNELLATDPDFKQQFDFENDLKSVIREKEADGLKTKLGSFEKDILMDTPVRTLPRTNYRKWAMAASIALLIGLGWIGYTNFAGPAYADLYEENFQPYPNTVYTITRGDAVESVERDAFVAYETGNYQKAIDGFDTIEVGEQKVYVPFYLGLSHLNLGQLTEAKTFFLKVSASKNEFVAESQWYLALIALKQENKEDAQRYLNELVSEYGYNTQKAQQLLQELE